MTEHTDTPSAIRTRARIAELRPQYAYELDVLRHHYGAFDAHGVTTADIVTTGGTNIAISAVIDGRRFYVCNADGNLYTTEELEALTGDDGPVVWCCSAYSIAADGTDVEYLSDGEGYSLEAAIDSTLESLANDTAADAR